MEVKERACGKCINVCEYDEIVVQAITEGFRHIGLSSVATFVGVVSGARNGLWTAYKKSDCGCCSSKIHAEIFAEAISLLLKILSGIRYESADLTAEKQAYAEVESLLNSYINYDVCGCDNEKREKIQRIYLNAFKEANRGSEQEFSRLGKDVGFLRQLIYLNTSNNGGPAIHIDQIYIDAVYLTAVVSYTKMLLGFECVPNIISQNQPNFVDEAENALDEYGPTSYFHTSTTS